MNHRLMRLLVTLGVLLTSNTGSSFAADSQLMGIWEGTGKQTNGSSWSIKMTMTESDYIIDYPSLRCGGKLDLISQGNNEYVFRERISYTKARGCTNNGKLVLSFSDTNVMQWKWYYPNGRFGAGAELNLTSTPVVQSEPVVDTLDNNKTLIESLPTKTNLVNYKSQNFPGKYAWDGRQDFAAGYFDTFADNGVLIALPSIYSNNFTSFAISPVDENKCFREKPYKDETFLKLDVSKDENLNSRSLPIMKNGNQIGTIDDVVINGLRGWRYGNQVEVLGETVTNFQKSLCYTEPPSNFRDYTLTPFLLARGTYKKGRTKISGYTYGFASQNVCSSKPCSVTVNPHYLKYWDGMGHPPRLNAKVSGAGNKPKLFLAKDIEPNIYNVMISGLPTSTKIQQYANIYLSMKANLESPNIPSLSLKSIPSQPILAKDEFETTATFEARQTEAQEKWEAEVRRIEAENQKLQSEHEKKVSNAEREYQSQLQTVSSDSYRQSMYREGFNKGIKLVLGKPYFRDIVYDADNQKMNATVFSAQEETFSRSLFFDVPLSTARSFKADLQNKKIVPVITFDENLNVISAKTLSNTGLIDLDFQQAKESASVEQLEDFIKKHPQSTKVGLARSEIAKLKAEEARRQAEREAKRREAEALAEKRAEEKARQDAYDYEHACKNYYVGYVGEWERTGWLATGEKFVVRYTNPERKSVTIEATESGNSLSYGENKELSCFDLLQGERRARN